MPRGRPKDSDPSVEWKIHIRGTLAAKVELLLLDPMRKKVKYGARGALLEQLLEQWVEEQLRYKAKEETEAVTETEPLRQQEH